MRERFVARYRSRMTNEGDVLVASQRYRDQGRNVADAMDKLRDMLAAVATAAQEAQADQTQPRVGRPSQESKELGSRKKQLRRRVEARSDRARRPGVDVR